MHNRFESRLKKVAQLFEEINGKKFCVIMVDELKPEFNSIKIDGEEFILEKDKNSEDFIKEYQRKNKVVFNNSNSMTVIIKNYGRK